MHAANAPDAGHDQAVGVQRGRRVGGQGDRRRRPARARARRSGGCPSRSRGRRRCVDGSERALGGRARPVSRGSSATASRSARASALNCASTRWCGSRPASTRTCSASWAWTRATRRRAGSATEVPGPVAADRDVRLALGLAGVHAVGPAGHVDGGLHERLVERHGGVAEPADARPCRRAPRAAPGRARSRCPRRCGGRRCGCRRRCWTVRSTSACRPNAVSMWS